MPSSRFFRIWLLWSFVYLFLSIAGPNGPRPFWPHLSQHLLQARAWAGSDIHLEGDVVIPVSPRLDLTPYFEHRVIEDPREDSLISNIAVRIPGPGGRLVPAQDFFDSARNDGKHAGFRCDLGFPPGPAFLLFPLYLLLGSALATGWLGPVLGGLAVASIDGLFGLLAPRLALPLDALPANALSILAGGGAFRLAGEPNGDLGARLAPAPDGNRHLLLKNGVISKWRAQFDSRFRLAGGLLVSRRR